ncbi:large-conductance mechanosensitive channel protein MscL [Heyndrickxia sp. NPDC080065]|uniref:large-conductance mechanosensitive channel protein MscL n=1 Tax=Heyndrickxia sp. NPDC080065 TaxID=3390568 RepID=UPI003D08F677
MLNDFKKFALKGNVMDLAIGVIIGAAFGKIVSSLVGDIVMPILGTLLGGFDFTDLHIAKIKYGQFIQNVVDFLIISFSIFLFIRFFERFKKKEETVEPEPTLSNEEKLLGEIRDLLKERNNLSDKN